METGCPKRDTSPAHPPFQCPQNFPLQQGRDLYLVDCKVLEQCATSKPPQNVISARHDRMRGTNFALERRKQVLTGNLTLLSGELVQTVQYEDEPAGRSQVPEYGRVDGHSKAPTAIREGLYVSEEGLLGNV